MSHFLKQNSVHGLSLILFSILCTLSFWGGERAWKLLVLMVLVEHHNDIILGIMAHASLWHASCWMCISKIASTPSNGYFLPVFCLVKIRRSTKFAFATLFWHTHTHTHTSWHHTTKTKKKRSNRKAIRSNNHYMLLVAK